MKKLVLLIIPILLIFSCDLINNPEDNQDSGIDFSLQIPNGLKSISRTPTSFSEGYKAWVWGFDSSRSAVAIGGSSDYEVELLWDNSVSKWRGRLDLTDISGETTFLAVVFNGLNQVEYRGIQPITISSLNRNSNVTLEAAIKFEVGEVGPGGGYIFYDKESYGSDGWRYLEAAPADFSYDWTDTYLDSGYLINNGDVYEDKAPSGYGAEDVLLYTKKDFYWGPTGSLGTLASIGKGVPNFGILDAATTATPRLRNGKGRKIIINPSNPRRDTPDSLKAQALNGRTDWFVPSESELTQMYANRASVPGLSAVSYWSSTENSTTTRDTEYNVDIPNARTVDMGTGAASDASRDTVKPIRPARRF